MHSRRNFVIFTHMENAYISIFYPLNYILLIEMLWLCRFEVIELEVRSNKSLRVLRLYQINIVSSLQSL